MQCSCLHQQLTDSLSQLMLVTHEGPATLSREQLVDVYVWYRKTASHPATRSCCEIVLYIMAYYVKGDCFTLIFPQG